MLNLSPIEKARIAADTEKAITEKEKLELEIAALRKEAGKKELPNVFLDLAKLITQFGSSLAGITIIVGVLGFLSDSSHNRKLGIETDLANPLTYVATGGRFLLNSGDLMLNYGLNRQTAFSLLLVSLVLPCIRFSAHKPKYELNFEAFTLCVICLYVTWLLGGISNGIGRTSEYMTAGIDDTPVNRWLVAGDYARLNQYYASFCTPLLVIIILLGYWYWKKNQTPVNFFQTNTILKSITNTLLIFAVLGLSVIHGIALQGYNYPAVLELGFKEKRDNPFYSERKPADTAGNVVRCHDLYLISKTDKTLVCYDKTSYHVLCLFADRLSYYKLSGTQNIFSGRPLADLNTK